MTQRTNFSVLWFGGIRAVMLGALLFLWVWRGYGMDGAGVRDRGVMGAGRERREAAPLSIVVSTLPATCGNANGSILMAGMGGTPPYSYSLNGGPYQASGTFNGYAGGAYTATVMDQTGATVTQGVPLGNLAGPQVFVQPIAADCANNDGELDVIITGGTQPMTVSVDGVSYGNSNLIGGLTSGNHFVSVQDNNGCLVTQFTNVPLSDNLMLTMGPGATVCQGKSVTLTETTNATAFSWTPATSLNNGQVAQPVATPAATTTYQLTATLGVCVLTGPETVTVMPAPTPTVNSGALLVCYGQSVQLQGGGGVSYQWSPATYLNSTTIPDPVVQQPKTSVSYNLNVTDAAGCTSVQPAVVLVVVTPPPVLFAGNDTAILIGQTLPLDAVDVNHAGFSSYQWTPALGLDNPSIQDPVATVTGDITYIVTATTPAGCMGTDSITIKAVTAADIVVPNAFTPNGDGRNDVFRVHAIGIKDFKAFRVFNRWGQMVFSTTDEGVGWDGTLGGQAQPMGTYVWVAVGVDFGGRVIERRGTVILLR